MAKFKPHVWFTYKRMNWAVCAYCGLVALKNDRTLRRIRQGCEQDD